jgi:hypothetical protein
MSKVRVLVGTKKGAFILMADGKRKDWRVSGPHFAGWEMYHLKGSPVDPNRIYASQSSGWFGQIIQHSDDGGKTWNTPGSSPEELKSEGGMPKGESNKFVYDGEVGKHLWYDGTPHPWEFKRIWHIEPCAAPKASSGNRVPAAWRFIPSCWIQKMRSAFTSRFRRAAVSVPMTAGKRGSRSRRD